MIPDQTPTTRTRLIEPGTRTPPRTSVTPDGLHDVRTLPLEPASPRLRLFAVAAVGSEIGTEFEAYEIAEVFAAPPGTVVLTIAAANPAGPLPGLVTVTAYLSESASDTEPIAIWPHQGFEWPEIARTTVVFAARHPARSTR